MIAITHDYCNHCGWDGAIDAQEIEIITYVRDGQRRYDTYCPLCDAPLEVGLVSEAPSQPGHSL